MKRGHLKQASGVTASGKLSFWYHLCTSHHKIFVFAIESMPAAMPSGFQWTIPSECVSRNSPFLALVTEGVIVTSLRKIAKAHECVASATEENLSSDSPPITQEEAEPWAGNTEVLLCTN